MRGESERASEGGEGCGRGGGGDQEERAHERERGSERPIAGNIKIRRARSLLEEGPHACTRARAAADEG